MLKKNRLGNTSLFCSPVGFGSYRVHQRSMDHRKSLELALDSGVNLIDTSTNYMDGSSESLIGDVLAQQFNFAKLKRSDVILVTKAGYIQGNNLMKAQEREAQGKPFSHVSKMSPDLWHSFAPDFLAEQLSQSLHRLKVESVDVLLIHNPEYFLKAGGSHEEYYKAFETAFRHLEAEVAQGRIQYYGVSSNTFPDPKESDEFTSLEMLWEIAEKLAPESSDGRHHFRVIQFPFNLFELGAVAEENNGYETVLEFAQKHEIGTLLNRPLNAFYGNEIQRLCDFKRHSVEHLEHEIERWVAESMTLESALKMFPGAEKNSLSWGHALEKNRKNIHDYLSFRDLLRYQILPARNKALEAMKTSGNAEMKEWAENYEPITQKLFQAISDQLETELADQSGLLNEILIRRAPSLSTSRTLSQKVIRIYQSIPGVHCVLVGMRHPEYVRDILGVSDRIPTPEAFETLSAAEEWISELGLDQ